MAESIKVKLTKEALNSAGEKVKEVTISEPKGVDLEELGSPIVEKETEKYSGDKVVSRDLSTNIDFSIASQYLERCANVPIDVLRNQPMSVMRECCVAVCSFLVQPQGETETS